ncbi:AMP nucleosidase, partial [hydrothermal vent metagenome]
MNLISPDPLPTKSFSDPTRAWEYIDYIYERNTLFIREQFLTLAKGQKPQGKVRAFYPKVEVSTASYQSARSSMPFGFLHSPGVYSTTISATKLFKTYLIEQLSLVLKNHGGVIDVSESDTPIPLHFAAAGSEELNDANVGKIDVPLRDLFDAPDLANTDDEISNGTLIPNEGGPYPLAAFTAPRIDYSLHRL